jgi:Gamma-glutamyl cyclotransferase, AIG2-like
MLYFAYGSDLDPTEFRARCPRSREIGVAALQDHKVHFPAYSERWNGGAAGLAVAHGHRVWGYVYELDPEDVAALEREDVWFGEGDPRNRVERSTGMVELTRPDDGSIPRRLRVTIYAARPTQGEAPTVEWLETAVRGARARLLPEEYLAELVATPVAGSAAE